MKAGSHLILSLTKLVLYHPTLQMRKLRLKINKRQSQNLDTRQTHCRIQALSHSVTLLLNSVT
jgi:hypothetical protein